jgi:hypothetical protein
MPAESGSRRDGCDPPGRGSGRQTRRPACAPAGASVSGRMRSPWRSERRSGVTRNYRRSSYAHASRMQPRVSSRPASGRPRGTAAGARCGRPPSARHGSSLTPASPGAKRASPREPLQRFQVVQGERTAGVGEHARVRVDERERCRVRGPSATGVRRCVGAAAGGAAGAGPGLGISVTAPACYDLASPSLGLTQVSTELIASERLRSAVG